MGEPKEWTEIYDIFIGRSVQPVAKGDTLPKNWEDGRDEIDLWSETEGVRTYRVMHGVRKNV